MGLMDGAGLVGSIVATLSVARAASDSQMVSFDAVAWLQLLILIVALILCAIASAAETALTSISRIKLKNLVESGDSNAIKIRSEERRVGKECRSRWWTYN